MMYIKAYFLINIFFRFHDHWRFVLQRLTSLAALITYLETETLIGRDETATMIGGNDL